MSSPGVTGNNATLAPKFFVRKPRKGSAVLKYPANGLDFCTSMRCDEPSLSCCGMFARFSLQFSSGRNANSALFDQAMWKRQVVQAYMYYVHMFSSRPAFYHTCSPADHLMHVERYSVSVGRKRHSPAPALPVFFWRKSSRRGGCRLETGPALLRHDAKPSPSRGPRSLSLEPLVPRNRYGASTKFPSAGGIVRAARRSDHANQVVNATAV
jgi:hypothetical protein